MTGRQVIWIAIVIIIIGMTWGDPQPVSSSIRQLSPQSVGLNDVDDESDDNDMPLGAAGSIKIASIQSCVNTIEHLTAARDAALVDLSHGSRAPPRASAELNRRVVLLSLRTVFDRSEVSSASSFFDESSLDLLCRTWLCCYRFRARQTGGCSASARTTSTISYAGSCCRLPSEAPVQTRSRLHHTPLRRTNIGRSPWFRKP
jgi:hypothetical protein